MPTNNPRLIKAREELIQSALDKVRNAPEYGNFYTHSFYVIVCFGLQLDAKKEALFDNFEGIDKVVAIKRIEDFLRNHIK